MFDEKITIAFTKTASITSLFLTIVGTITGIKSVQSSQYGWLVVTILLLTLAICIFIVTFIKADMAYRYINKQIELISEAEKSIIISMRSLTDETKRKKCFQLDSLLEQKVRGNVSVRILCPLLYNDERRIGAEQLNNRGIDVRYVPGLEENDCKFVLVDGKVAVFSQGAHKKSLFSKNCSIVYSEMLGQILTEEFDDLWNSKGDVKAYDYSEYYQNYLK